MEFIGSDDSDDDLVIMSFQYLKLKDEKVNGVLKATEITDGSIMMDTGLTCSKFKAKDMVTNIKTNSLLELTFI